MTDKAKERVQRACHHTIMLRAKEGFSDYSFDVPFRNGEYLNVWQCADCGWVIELAPVLEESTT